MLLCFWFFFFFLHKHALFLFKLKWKLLRAWEKLEKNLEQTCTDVCYSLLITFPRNCSFHQNLLNVGIKLLQGIIYIHKWNYLVIVNLSVFLTSKCIFYMQRKHWNASQTQTAIRKAACLAVSKGTNMTIKHGKSRWKIYFRTCSNNRKIRE